MQKVGVSISRKPLSDKNFLASIATFDLSIKLFFNGFLLKSKNLYSSLSSSLVLISSSIGKGRTSAVDKIRSSFGSISIVPVSSFSFISLLFLILPLTAITYSNLSSFALSNNALSQSFSSNTTCMIPDLSLTSVNMIEPLFLDL